MERIGTFEQEMLGKGLKGRIWFWKKKRKVMDDDNFLMDAEVLQRILFGGRANIGRIFIGGQERWNVFVHPLWACYSIDDDGKINDLFYDMDFLRIPDRYFHFVDEEDVV